MNLTNTNLTQGNKRSKNNNDQENTITRPPNSFDIKM